MWRFVARVGVCLLPFAGVVTAAQADPVAISAEGATRTEACGGAAASIAGNRNIVTLTGICAGLQIRGESNSVTLALAPGALLDIEGNHNSVHYSGQPGGTPKLRILGSFTEVVPALDASAPAADTATVSGGDETIELDCLGKSVTLQGTRSHYRLRGACKALTVKGEANMVQADVAPGAQLLVQGNGIALTYTVSGEGAEPDGSVQGIGSSITRLGATGTISSSKAATNSTVPVLASVPILMHDLGASVTEPGTLVSLPDPAFTGAALSPLGETQLDRLSQLIAQINPTGLRLTGHDPADPTLATQRTKLVQDWLTSHAGKKLPIRESAGTGISGVDVLILR